MIGCGTVGGSLISALLSRSPQIADRTGTQLDVRRVAVRDLSKKRDVPADLLTSDPFELVNDDNVEVVVEVMGGIEPARSLIEAALRKRKPVVTANKELMALDGAKLAKLAEENDVDLLYEASVAGGIPLVRPLRESLAGERISRVVGILNGTTNYILTRMTEAGVDYKTALDEAQELGYAEADPTADVEGLDAAAKAAIIANLAFGASVDAQDVHPEGITSITANDIELARHLGYTVKLVGVISRHESGSAGVRVHPVMLPNDHPLASVRMSFNAVFVEGEDVGELMFYGRGAGGAPTASATLGDLIDAAHNLRHGGAGRLARPGNAALWPLEEQSSAFYLTLDVVDAAGVLAAVAQAFGEHDVSIRSMEQTGIRGEAHLVFVTHEAVEGNMQTLVKALHDLPVVRRVGNVIRVMEHG